MNGMIMGILKLIEFYVFSTIVSSVISLPLLIALIIIDYSSPTTELTGTCQNGVIQINHNVDSNLLLHENGHCK